jgi:hypothetical protein
MYDRCYRGTSVQTRRYLRETQPVDAVVIECNTLEIPLSHRSRATPYSRPERMGKDQGEEQSICLLSTSTVGQRTVEYFPIEALFGQLPALDFRIATGSTPTNTVDCGPYCMHTASLLGGLPRHECPIWSRPKWEKRGTRWVALMHQDHYEVRMAAYADINRPTADPRCYC